MCSEEEQGMELTSTNEGEYTLLAISGRLDSSSAGEAEAFFLQQVALPVRKFVIDLGSLSYISSAGLRVVLIAAKKAKAIQGRIIFAGLSESVHEIFKMSGFLTLLEAAKTREAAIERLMSGNGKE